VVADNPHRDLLDRATRAVEGIEATINRQEAAFNRHERSIESLFRRMDQRDAAAAKRDAAAAKRDAAADRRHEALTTTLATRHESLMAEHQRVLDRFARSENRVVEALGDLHLEVARNTARIDDSAAAIRANTQAVLSVLDRLGPAGG